MILLRAAAPANNEVVNSQSDLTIDPLFTIVTAIAFNDPPARPPPQQAAKDAPGLWGVLRVTLVVSNEHPVLFWRLRAEASKQIGDTTCPLLTALLARPSPLTEVTGPLLLQRTAVFPHQNRLPHWPGRFHYLLSSEEVLGVTFPQPGVSPQVPLKAWIWSLCHAHCGQWEDTQGTPLDLELGDVGSRCRPAPGSTPRLPALHNGRLPRVLSSDPRGTAAHTSFP